MSKKPYRLNWKGNEVIKATEDQICEILGEAALFAEGESKKDLKKGRGVRTGTLRRSIHAASPDYKFSQDNVDPDNESPERGGSLVRAKLIGGKFVVLLGSGLSYAMAIHQGWSGGSNGLKGTFAGYHYLVNGVDKTMSKMSQIVARHQVGK